MTLHDSAPYPMPYESFKAVHGFIEFSESDDNPEVEYCLEELAELIQAIQKLKRARKRGLKNTELTARKCLISEIAHVYLTLNHVREQENIALCDIQEAMDKKVEKWGFS